MLVACFLAAALPAHGEPGFNLVHVRGVFPDAADFQEGPEGEFRVECRDGDYLGDVFKGPPGEPIVGYAGEVPFLLGIDREGRVAGIHLLPSRETESFARRVSRELSGAWDGLYPEEAFGREVDAVSGATMTSVALIEGVERTLAELADLEEPFSRRGKRPGPAYFAVLAVLGLALFSFFRPRPGRRKRHVQNALNVAVPGFLGAAFLSLPVFAAWLEGNFAWPRQSLVIIVALPALAIPLFLGRNFYCHFFCPFGSAQEIAGKLNRRKTHAADKMLDKARFIRWCLVAAALAVFIGDLGFDLSGFEPFLFFRWSYAPFTTRVLALTFLAGSFLASRPWCRFCPTGAVLGGLARLGSAGRRFSRRVARRRKPASGDKARKNG